MGACHLWPTHRSGRAGISDAAVSRSTCFLAKAEEKVGTLWYFIFFSVTFGIYSGSLCWSISKGANSFPFCLLVSSYFQQQQHVFVCERGARAQYVSGLTSDQTTCLAQCLKTWSLSPVKTYDLWYDIVPNSGHCTYNLDEYDEWFFRQVVLQRDGQTFQDFKGVWWHGDQTSHVTVQLQHPWTLHSRYLMVHTYKSIGTLLDMFECWMILLFLILMILMVFTFSKTHFGTLKGIHVSSPFNWRFNWRMEAIIFQPFCFLSVRTWGRWPTLNSHWQSPGNGYTVTLRG